jgi:preprotein translocase subunit SecG
MHAIILTIHIVVSLMLIGLVLIQHGKGADAGAAFGGGGGGAGGGASGSLFGSRGSASFLSRSSAILAAVFFATSLTLAYFSVDRPEQAQSVTETAPAEQVKEQTPADLPEMP